MKSLRSAFATLTAQKVRVIGVSMDPVPKQRAFSDKFQVPFLLLCDTNGVICDAFRVEHPWGKPRRETFLFRDGALVDHNRSVNPAKQANDVLRKMNEILRQAPQ